MGSKKKGKEQNNKELKADTTNDETTNDGQNLDKTKDIQESSAIKHERTETVEAPKTIWRDKTLRTVIIFIGALHFFQIFGMVYLLHQNTTTHVIHPCHQSDSCKPVSKESSVVCGTECTDVSEKYKNVADDLSLYDKTLHNMIKNMTCMEDNMLKILQNIDVLQKNYTKTEEGKEHLKQVVDNFKEKMLEVEQNMSRFYEEVQKNISDLQKESLSEGKLQKNSSKEIRDLADENDRRISDHRKKFDEHKKKISDDVRIINASIAKLDGDLTEFNRTFIKQEKKTNGQFSDVKQSISELQMRVEEIEEAEKAKEEVDAEKKKFESTIASIKKLEDNIKYLDNHTKEREKHFNDKISRSWQSVNEIEKMVKEVDRKFEEESKEIKEKVDTEKKEVESKLAGVSGQLHSFSTELNDIKKLQNISSKEIRELSGETDRKMGDHEKKFDEHKKKIFDDVRIINASIEKLDGDLNECNKTFIKQEKKTNGQFSDVKQSTYELQMRVKELDEEAKKAKEEVDAEKKKLESTMAYIKKLEDNIKEIEKTVKEVDKKIEEESKKIEEKVDTEKKEVESRLAGVSGQLHYFSTELNDINLYIVGFLFLVVGGVIFTAYKILLPRKSSVTVRREPVYDPATAKSAPHSRVGGKLPSEIVQDISRKNLEPGINLISFNCSSQQFHKNLIDAVPKPRSTQIRSSYIQRVREIPQISPSKVVFIFVDFNERNIILEDPETEIGDLRRLTTQGVLNMGCEVFVIYVKDRGSQDLHQNQLYNPRLYSVDRHPILSKLKEKHRVLSLYDRFHPHQVKFLEDCFKRS